MSVVFSVGSHGGRFLRWG